MTALRLDFCSHQAAKVACERWHYSRSMPTPPLVKIGVWEDDAFIGVVIFSRGANKHLYRPYGIKQTEGAELTRIALREHATPVSRIMAIAVKLLKQQCSGLRLLISFADPLHDHVGTVYQAAGWLYAGLSPARHDFRDKRGRLWHSRMVSATGVRMVYGRPRRVLKRADCEPVKLPGKHRYLLPLDTEMRQRVQPLAKPYPRRRSIETDAPGDQPGTRALQCDPAAPSTTERVA